MSQDPEKKPPRKRKPAKTTRNKDGNKKTREESLKAILEQFTDRDRPPVADPNMIAAVLGEYLSCYILIGYNTEGEPIAFTSAKKSIDVDALNTGLHRFLTTYGLFGGHPPEPPMGPTQPDDEEM